MGKKSGEKAKFPKRVGGVKVPKELRRAGSRIVAVATSPAGLELLAASLRMASAFASAAVERKRGDRPAAVTVGAAPTGERQPAESARGFPPLPVGNDPHEIGVALGRMAEEALRGLFRPKA